MPTLPTDSVAVEKIVRDGLVTKFAGIDGLPNILTHRVYINDEKDAVRRMGYQHPANGKMEFRLLVIDFAGFKDTDVGCIDNPVYYLNYTLKLSVSHADLRSDNTTSTDTYARILIQMRARVLADFNVAGYEQLLMDALSDVRATFGQDSDETLIYGHHATLNARVEVTPSPIS
jgi:hypothetical protein